jgi:hypothetical protein
MPSPQVINHDALCKSTELRRCFELMLRDECSVGDWLTFFVKHSETVKVQARWSKVTVGTLKGMAKVLGVDANVRVRAQLLTLMTTKVVEMLNQHVEREEEQKQAADAKAAEEAVAEAAARARRKSSKKRKPEEKRVRTLNSRSCRMGIARPRARTVTTHHHHRRHHLILRRRHRTTTTSS